VTWRAFITGLVTVAGIGVLDFYSGTVKGYGGFGGSFFPGGCVLVLVVLVAIVNPLVKLVRRRWAFAQSELMLVWCMTLVAATVPTAGMHSILAGAPYMARRPDIYWEDDGSLTVAPGALVVSKDPKSVAAQQYFEGAPEGRVPWKAWIGPLVRWGIFLMLMYAAVFFMCAILRRQWVERERLMFPLAAIPLEFTEEGAAPGLLPAAFRNRAFVAGAATSVVFRFVRALPLFFGASRPWPLTMPLADIFSDTPLASMDFFNFDLWPTAVGFAYLVPADISLGMWVFYLFSRVELYVGKWLAIPVAGQGSWGPMLRWQQFGANVAFVIGMLYVARRHLWAVTRKATGLSRSREDAEEPVSYRVAFWGFVLTIGGCVAWLWHYGMSVPMALAAMALLFCWYIASARIVAQGGVYMTRGNWILVDVLHGITGRLAGVGAVLAGFLTWLIAMVPVAPPLAMDAFRISSVFTRRRRLFVVALIAAMLAGLVSHHYVALKQAYGVAAFNFVANTWGTREGASWVFGQAQAIITNPSGSSDFYWGCFSIGAVMTTFLMLMRGRFYWWPLHPIGLVVSASGNWDSNQIWFPFLLGWLVKVTIMKFAGGHMLRAARFFFVAFILTEVFLGALAVMTALVSEGAIPPF
jgi:hypothetical protein